MAISLVSAVVIGIIGVLFARTFLGWMGTPDDVIGPATEYLQILFGFAIFMTIYNMGSGILRAMGDSKRPLYFLIVTCFSNIFLDIFFVVVLKQGIAGAAIATVLAQIISAVLVVITLCRLPEDIRLDLLHIQVDTALLGRILLIGLPAGLQFITFDLSNLLVQAGINSFGDITVAAWAAYFKAGSLTWMVSGAFGVAITTFVGQNFGAQKYSRIRQSVRVCLAMSIGAQLLISFTILFFREFILGIYTTDLAVIQTGAYMVTIAAPFCALFVPVEVLGGTMRGTGYSLVPTVITAIFACLFRTLWVMFVVNRWHSLFLLVSCYPISWFLCATVFCIVYFRGKWLKAA
jgi:putative MATE family efflux protein